MSDEETSEPGPPSETPPTPPLPAAPTGGDFGFGSSYQPVPRGLSTGNALPISTMDPGIRRQGGILMLAGSVIVLASLPLPEFKVTSDSGLTASRNGMHGVALWLLIICVFAGLRGLSALRPIGFVSALPILSGALITWAIYTRWSTLNNAIKEAPILHLSATIGYGFWVTCLGGALIVVGSIILQFAKPQRS